MTTPRYCTREQVSTALGDLARPASVIDRATGAATQAITSLTHRRFYPEQDTRSFDWPSPDRTDADSWRLWLDENELISLDTLTSGGTAITEFFLEPQPLGPPYSSITIDLGGTGSFSSGDTFQRAVTATGLFGYTDEQAPAGALAAAVVSTSASTIDVTNGALVGVGSLLQIGTERLQVTERGWLDSGQNLQADLSAAKSDVTVSASDGTEYAAGERLLLDAEQLLVTDVAGNDLVVKRAQAGTVLATHSSSDIYASRRLTVERGVLGSTASTHLISAAITAHVVPELVNACAVALAINQVLQETGGYSQSTGSGDTKTAAPGGGLDALRAQLRASLGRKARSRTI